MLKVWNVFLICGTFFMTIFGTFLTRSGLIASVHAFAQSGIGIWFVYFMGVIAATSIALIVYRLPKLRSEGSFIDAELIIRATRMGFSILQFGVDYFPRTRGASTLSSPRIIATILREMVQLRGELKLVRPIGGD